MYRLACVAGKNSRLLFLAEPVARCDEVEDALDRVDSMLHVCPHLGPAAIDGTQHLAEVLVTLSPALGQILSPKGRLLDDIAFARLGTVTPDSTFLAVQEAGKYFACVHIALSAIARGMSLLLTSVATWAYISRYRFAAHANARKMAHRSRFAQDFLHGWNGPVEPLLQKGMRSIREDLPPGGRCPLGGNAALSEHMTGPRKRHAPSR